MVAPIFGQPVIDLPSGLLSTSTFRCSMVTRSWVGVILTIPNSCLQVITASSISHFISLPPLKIDILATNDHPLPWCLYLQVNRPVHAYFLWRGFTEASTTLLPPHLPLPPSPLLTLPP